MESGARFWGELKTTLDTDTGLASVEKALIAKTRPVKAQCAKLSFKREQQTNLSTTAATTDSVSSLAANEVVMNTIQLLSILRKLRTNIVLTPSESKLVAADSESIADLPPPPASSVCTVPRENLSDDSIRQLLKRSIILILAHSGFEKTYESIVELLTDVCASFIKKICDLLRVESDTKHLKSENDFADVIDRVLTEIGFPIAIIQHFESCLRSYRNNVLKEARRKMCLSSEKSNLSLVSDPLSNYSQILTIDVKEQSENF
ncbi:STAGA complex 65 subunit gamma-like protein [Dinothrombium tinctorium]|uniref:STAGA complex 65 subunit gamma-like protein n=1 Tax=Dinothrombium tinctorium TaxID=1965070 RepID=A0A3S4QLY5_9ACAR|nr:STAGA complex 65 subunit gamma-like protein [Dinothrombium tinctorium]RWS05120.1 STAGA complex 65 subunit gamma-like protein [Dinothrombium tinctorium]